MNSLPDPFRNVLEWLTSHAGFPAGRLPARAEVMLFAAALAAAESAAVQPAFAPRGDDGAQVAALRAHGLRRSRVHYKSDNSTKT